MQLQTNIRIDATALVQGPLAVRAREPREPRPVESGDATGDARSRTAGEQAAIVNFGAGALDRAQRRPGSSAVEPETDPAQGAEQLSDDQQQAVEDLQRRDREVRSHEQTHRSVGGQFAGSIHLDYQVGPDGERYAVSGSTPIDVSPVANDPEATLRKMQIVERAASAPINPSAADRQVASEAARQTQQARAELAASRYGSARELAPERAGGATSSPTAGQEPAEPSPPARFAGRPGEPEAAAPGRLLAVRA